MLYALYAHRRLVPLVQIKCLLPSLLVLAEDLAG